MEAIQTCKKTFIKTFSLPFQCTVANAVMDPNDVLKELLSHKAELEKQLKAENRKATVTIDQANFKLNIVEETEESASQSLTKTEAAGISRQK